VLLAPFQLIEPLKEILAETAPKRPISIRAASAGELMARLDSDGAVDLVITDSPAQRGLLLEAGRLDLGGEQIFAKDRIVLIVRSERATPIRRTATSPLPLRKAPSTIIRSGLKRAAAEIAPLSVISIAQTLWPISTKTSS
jgi:ABC-type molybdate transport system substrate-binding protein